MKANITISVSLDNVSTSQVYRSSKSEDKHKHSHHAVGKKGAEKEKKNKVHTAYFAETHKI